MSKRKCSCSLHSSESTDDGQQKIKNLKDGKSVRKDVRSKLLKLGLIKEWSNYVCASCEAFAEKEVSEAKKRKIVDEDVESVVEKLKSNTLNDDNLELLSYELGVCLKNRNKKACAKGDGHREMGHFENLKVKEEINTFDNCMLQLATGLSEKTNDDINEFRMLYTLENLVGLADDTCLGCLSFCMLLMIYYITGSKSVIEIFSKFSNCGSYSTMRRFIGSNNSSEVEYPQDGDGVVFIDNNQILTRRWDVIYDCKALVSVVTTLLFLQPPIDFEIQRNPMLCPFKWLNVTDVQVSLLYENNFLNSLFRIHRNDFLTRIMEEVKNDQILNEGKCTDEIDNLKDGETVPEQTHGLLKTVIFDSEGNMSLEKISSKEPYDSLSSDVKGKVKSTLFEPLFVNPCSYDSISDVFNYLLKKCDREWLAIGCDGLPYLLGSRLIENKFQCKNCEQCVSSQEKFISHMERHGVHEIQNIQSFRVYKNILMVPGFGHYEINYVKAMFKLLWPVVLHQLARLLGFRSMKALSFCESASNHHKSWSILQICLSGCSRELVLPYVRSCIKGGSDCEVEGFFDFVSKNNSPTYMFMYKSTFGYLFALDLFRTGVRRNNTNVIHCAMHRLSSLFYGLNMTTYQEIDVRRLTLHEQSPPEVQTFLDNMSCMSATGHPSKGEGGDFILEATNRLTKMWMPAGSANERRWLSVYKNLPSMEKIKNNIGVLGETDYKPDDTFRNRRHKLEIDQWRKEIRNSNFLVNTEMSSISGTILDKELVMFDEKCQRNRKTYCETFPATYKCEKIFFTPEDRIKFHNIANKTKPEIGCAIVNLISQIEEGGHDAEAQHLMTVWKKQIKLGNKKLYLDFHTEVVQVLESTTETTDI